MQYRVPYMHQHSFVSMSFLNVAQDNNAAMDEITNTIENDLLRDLMLGIRTFPKEVLQECYICYTSWAVQGGNNTEFLKPECPTDVYAHAC